MSGTKVSAGRLQQMGAGLQQMRGVVAIEFALIFPVFFAIIYGIICYGTAFLMMQSFTYAAEDALRAALAAECAASTCTEAELKPVVTAQVQQSLDWLAASVISEAISADDFFACNAEMLCKVRLGAAPLLNGITLPLVGEIPDLPERLVGIASLRM
ncbi:TadE/TadG family type IV pilus assembly protein [Spongiibacter tropicus]|uniref:TadE/TadG family type IV pilus assembly protein n=1 Tax=Spongiibacter tropicus TaxID=454602 RepID=UPI0003B54601|nr:TadE/TadG family type IV pilus assembly protein [Spongiibacter tropicus]